MYTVSGVVRGGGAFKLSCMIQSSHRFGLAASAPNLFAARLDGWGGVLVFVTLTLAALRLAAEPA